MKLIDLPSHQLFATISTRLFQGAALKPEELIDLLTLKENVNEQSGDFASALDVLVRAKVSSFVLSIWDHR